MSKPRSADDKRVYEMRGTLASLSPPYGFNGSVTFPAGPEYMSSME
jgi:hypothetical protein